MNLPTVRWGIIGCGNVCEVKSGPAFYKTERSLLAAVMRRDGRQAEDFARRHLVPAWYDDADALIADPNVNAVYIATPPGSHRDYTLKAAAAGKAVYVEKPMARTHDECQQMIGACRSAGVPLYVGFYRRRLPRFLKARELVQQGAIGKPRFVHITLTQQQTVNPASPPWRVLPEHSGGGNFLDLASHTLDFLDYVFGPVASVTGTAANQADAYAAEDYVAGAFTFESGVQGLGVWSFAASHSEDLIEIVGENGRIRLSTFTTDPVVLETIDGQTQQFAEPTPAHVHQPLVQTIVEELTGTRLPGHCPSTGESGARTSWVMDQFLAGYRREHAIKFTG